MNRKEKSEYCALLLKYLDVLKINGTSYIYYHCWLEKNFLRKTLDFLLQLIYMRLR